MIAPRNHEHVQQSQQRETDPQGFLAEDELQLHL